MSALHMGIVIAGTAVLGYAGVTLFEWSKEPRPQLIMAPLTKWVDDHEAAISLTYDGDPENESDVIEMVKRHELTRKVWPKVTDGWLLEIICYWRFVQCSLHGSSIGFMLKPNRFYVAIFLRPLPASI